MLRLAGSLVTWEMSSGVNTLSTQVNFNCSLLTLFMTSPQAPFGSLWIKIFEEAQIRPDQAPEVTLETRLALASTVF